MAKGPDPKEWEILYISQIGGHPAQRLLQMAVREWATTSVYTPAYDYEAVYVEDPFSEVVAALSFERREWNRHIDIAWVYVLPDYRRNGLHTRMFEAVKSIALRDGYNRVRRHVSVDNHVMINSIESQGGMPKTVQYEHNLLKHPKLNRGSVENKYKL